MTQEAGGLPYELDFSELSDGQRELIILYTLLESLTAGQGCLFLDEPEAHVGLTEVQPWLVELRDRFSESVQVFVVSHHPESSTTWRPGGFLVRPAGRRIGPGANCSL